MVSSILTSVTQEEIRVGLVEDGQVVEVYVERKKDASTVGNIYKGKVVKILPGMQSAFVDIGLEKSAFLYVGDIRTDIVEDYAELFEEEPTGDIEVVQGRRRHDYPIEDLIQEGQELLVQVSKDPLGTKGARVTSYVTIPGRHLVLMPNVDHVGISRRIEDEEERMRLRALVEDIRPNGAGLIIRTASEGALQEDVRRDLEFLARVWQNIQDRKDRVSAPFMLYSDLDLIFRSVRDLMSHDVERLVIDSRKDYEDIQDFVNTYFPKLLDRIEHYEGAEPLFEHYGIELDISRALDRRVWLKSGGGKFVGKEDLEETILKTNLEAVKEVSYQIRLRNLGGIIIVDFIDMEQLENREKVLNAFREALSKDRAKYTISHISELGLIQMTRKRVRESLGRILCETCPYCEGKGFVKSTQTLCYEILRKLQRAASQGAQRAIVTAHPVVAERLTEEERLGIEDIEHRHGIKIIVTADPNLHQENYEISTM
jgi:ribonuclease G